MPVPPLAGKKASEADLPVIRLFAVYSLAPLPLPALLPRKLDAHPRLTPPTVGLRRFLRFLAKLRHTDCSLGEYQLALMLEKRETVSNSYHGLGLCTGGQTGYNLYAV